MSKRRLWLMVLLVSSGLVVVASIATFVASMGENTSKNRHKPVAIVEATPVPPETVVPIAGDNPHHINLLRGSNGIWWWDDYVNGHYTICYAFTGAGVSCVIDPDKTPEKTQ